MGQIFERSCSRLGCFFVCCCCWWWWCFYQNQKHRVFTERLLKMSKKIWKKSILAGMMVWYHASTGRSMGQSWNHCICWWKKKVLFITWWAKIFQEDQHWLTCTVYKISKPSWCCYLIPIPNLTFSFSMSLPCSVSLRRDINCASLSTSLMLAMLFPWRYKISKFWNSSKTW